MFLLYLGLLLVLSGFCLSAPIIDGPVGVLDNIEKRNQPHQVCVVNVDGNTKDIWAQMISGEAREITKGLFIGRLEAYDTLKNIISDSFNPPWTQLSVGNVYSAPHGKCKVLYCNGQNFGVSLCSRRQGNDPVVSLDGIAIGNILQEWRERFKHFQCENRDKGDGGFSTPNIGRSYWSEDTSWSINIEECGTQFIDFRSDVARDV